MTCTDCAPVFDRMEPIITVKHVELCPLHAASAELLDALKFMLAHREDQLIQAGVTRKAADIEMARAAIAKAERQS